MAFLTRVFARSHVVPPSRSSGGLRRAGVLLDEVEPLDRDEQLVVAGVAELEELLRAVADADLLQADEHADAVVDVDDEVADLEVAQVREKRLASPTAGAPAPGALPRRRRPRRRSGERRRAGGSPRDRLPDGHQHGRVPRVLGALDRHGEDLVVLEQLDRALGAARRRGDEQHRLALLAQPPDLGRPSRHAAVQLDGGLTRTCGGRAIVSRASRGRAAASAVARASRDWTDGQARTRADAGRRRASRRLSSSRRGLGRLRRLRHVERRCQSSYCRSSCSTSFVGVRFDLVALRHDDRAPRRRAPGSRRTSRRAVDRARARRAAERWSPGRSVAIERCVAGS